ncbi:MAG: serine acetyltransferase, partial [Bacilli bacterium]|nr:serine acetyltransferase [Bacilli bacterium]
MGIVCEKPFQELPKSENVIAFVIETRKYLFPGFFEEVKPNLEEYLNAKLTAIKFLFLKNICNDKDKLAIFIDKLEEINIALKDDLHFFYDSDPACEGDEEIVLTYPGYFAITYHRIAHVLYDLNIKVLPRIISEYAHSRTGIDIHPGATISHPFFIDHGTGIVIGETAVIGHHVKIYHGVTLGALS